MRPSGRLAAEAFAAGADPADILDRGLIAGMNAVGVLFRAHEIFLPDVLLASKAMYAGLEPIKPLLAKRGMPAQGRVVIGSVQGDLHDIGKNLVGIERWKPPGARATSLSCPTSLSYLCRFDDISHLDDVFKQNTASVNASC